MKKNLFLMAAAAAITCLACSGNSKSSNKPQEQQTKQGKTTEFFVHVRHTIKGTGKNLMRVPYVQFSAPDNERLFCTDDFLNSLLYTVAPQFTVNDGALVCSFVIEETLQYIITYKTTDDGPLMSSCVSFPLNDLTVNKSFLTPEDQVTAVMTEDMEWEPAVFKWHQPGNINAGGKYVSILKGSNVEVDIGPNGKYARYLKKLLQLQKKMSGKTEEFPTFPDL